jgi:hypothetical protein
MSKNGFIKKNGFIFDKKSPIHVEYMDNNFATLYPFHYIENDFIIIKIGLNKKSYFIGKECNLW